MGVTKIYIGHVKESSHSTLEEKFAEYGRVVAYHSRGTYAFCHMDNFDEALQAANDLNNTNHDGNYIKVERAAAWGKPETGSGTINEISHKESTLDQSGRRIDLPPRGRGRGRGDRGAGRGFPRGPSRGVRRPIRGAYAPRGGRYAGRGAAALSYAAYADPYEDQYEDYYGVDPYGYAEEAYEEDGYAAYEDPYSEDPHAAGEVYLDGYYDDGTQAYDGGTQAYEEEDYAAAAAFAARAAAARRRYMAAAGSASYPARGATARALGRGRVLRRRLPHEVGVRSRAAYGDPHGLYSAEDSLTAEAAAHVPRPRPAAVRPAASRPAASYPATSRSAASYPAPVTSYERSTASTEGTTTAIAGRPPPEYYKKR